VNADRDPRVPAMVAAGGTLGTAVRALLERQFAPAAGAWPWPTFAINISGAFVLGLLLETLARHGTDTGTRRLIRLGAGTGFLGGYTTYSTFAVETIHLTAPTALAYAALSTLLGALAAASGFWLARRMPAGTDPGRTR